MQGSATAKEWRKVPIKLVTTRKNPVKKRYFSGESELYRDFFCRGENTARWLDSTTGRFLTEDPARDGTNWYEYCRNNPLRFVDKDGLKVRDVGNLKQETGTGNLGEGTDSIAAVGCVLATFVRMAIELGADTDMNKANDYALENNLFLADENGDCTLLNQENGAALVNGLVNDPKIKVVYEGSASGTATELAKVINTKESETTEYFATARIGTGNAAGTSVYDHSLSVNGGSVFAGDFTDIENALQFEYNDTSGANRTGTTDTSRVNVPKRVDFFKIEKQNWAMMENAQ